MSTEELAAVDEPSLISTYDGGRSCAPVCAELPSWGAWRNGPLPEPPGGLSFDGLAVWSVVLSHPGATQREIFEHLVPTLGRRRVKEALGEGLEAGWLTLRQEKQGGRHRHFLSRTAVTRDGAVDAALAVLEHALGEGELLDRCKVIRLTNVLRGVVPLDDRHAYDE